MNDSAVSDTPAPSLSDVAAATPMLAQYLEIKRAHPGSLLFYRMGDFYELFFEDAVTASRALSLTLTRRGKHNDDDIPMCGVPVHAAETYLSRLIRLGFRVAVCEQIEDPAAAKKRGAKSVVKRDVVRVITPGTITEDALLDARRHNYLSALAETGGSGTSAMGFAWLDLSTGEFWLQSIEPARLASVLARVAPGEILVADRLIERPELFEIFQPWKAALTPLPASRFDSENGRRRLEALYGVKALEGFGAFSRSETAAGGALVDYVELTQKGKLPRLATPVRIADSSVLEIDPATRRNLELTESLSNERRGSLLHCIDRTLTGAGARLLAARLSAPLTDGAAIDRRLDMVAWFVGESRRRDSMRTALKGVGDIERALSRLGIGRGGPRDLAGLRDALGQVPALKRIIADGGLAGIPEGIAEAGRELGEHGVLVERLQRALGPDLPLNARDGGFIAAGYSAELDELRTLRDESRRLIAALQSRYAAETKIPTLKVRHNNVLGYFIEVTQTHADKIEAGAGSPFIHRQTMAGAMRFTTVELNELEAKITSAADKALALELGLFETLVKDTTGRAAEIAGCARAMAALDVASSLAELAVERRYCRPLVDQSRDFAVKGGRHPVVEAALGEASGPAFVANDCVLGEQHAGAGGGKRVWLLTGPNMAGKSTFLRQNALIAILAQMGAYVPAESVRLGAVDRLFSRVGAADDLARGRSTFMVEMVETATILNRATERSLVILDEIGRGTATFDGLSIAWATVEHLHEVNRSRALFATHYHELTALAARLAGLACWTMRVKEWQGDVVFLHEVAPGAADRSYGIHVARLAGLPSPVIARAEEVLKQLEAGEGANAATRLADDLPLFNAARPKAGLLGAPAAASAADAALRQVNPDELTPKEALETLYRLQGLLAKP
jgi:DNA mismatch repair protein MutS